MSNENDTQPFCHRKPDIEYPCEWEYRVIGTDQQALIAAIEQVCASKNPVINLSNVSSKGKYVSMNVTVTVEDEAIRNDIFNQLQQNEAVKMVI